MKRIKKIVRSKDPPAHGVDLRDVDSRNVLTIDEAHEIWTTGRLDKEIMRRITGSLVRIFVPRGADPDAVVAWVSKHAAAFRLKMPRAEQLLGIPSPNSAFSSANPREIVDLMIAERKYPFSTDLLRTELEQALSHARL